MNARSIRILRLEAGHARGVFACGVPALDRYFHEQVTQDERRRVTVCFVAVDREDAVLGYYTLASASVALGDLPPRLAGKLPRYPTVPVVRLGRLAIARDAQGGGLGGALLADALVRVALSEIGAYAMVVDAKDEQAVAFYRHHGFLPLASSPLQLFLPVASVAKLVR